MSKRWRVLWNYIKYKELHRFTSKEELVVFQEKRIKKLLKHLKNNSPYYREFLQKDLSLKNLPIVDKKQMMDEFDHMVCEPITKKEALEEGIEAEEKRDFKQKHKDLTIGLSSGTSGHRGVFVLKDQEIDMWTGAILARMLPDMKGKKKIAFFLRADSNLYENVNDKKIALTYYDIYQPMKGHIEKLQKDQPNILVGPPSVLRLVAENIERSHIKLNLERVISVAEVLEPIDEAYFKKQFDQSIIHQVYQSTEGFLAYTCRFGTLHMNEDIVHVEQERLDDQRFIPIITDFMRRTQPIVRYRLNDVLIKKKGLCPCGSHFMALDAIEGREDDIFIIPNLDGQPIHVFPDLLRRVMVHTEGIKAYHILQTGEKDIKIECQAEEGRDLLHVQEDIYQAINGLFDKMKLPKPKVTFGDYTHHTEKKMKRIERL